MFFSLWQSYPTLSSLSLSLFLSLSLSLSRCLPDLHLFLCLQEMVHGKVNLELISNKISRNKTFHNRKKGLKKKMYEFSTLCGVDACMIVYGPYLDGCPMELDTWPSNPAEVQRIINCYKSTPKEYGKSNDGISDYFKGKKKKIDEQIEKVRQQNRESTLEMWDDHIKEFSDYELRELITLLDNKVEGVKAQIEFMKGSQQAVEQVGAAAAAAQGMMGCSLHTQSAGQSDFSDYYTQDLFQSEGMRMMNAEGYRYS